tara:strand:+ start:871 stop:1095 length:225 start_codon:yes stop_codon:yes gene_type:complete
MEKRTLDKIISFLREQSVGGAPTMSVGNVGYTSKGGQTRAGFDPVLGTMERRKQPKYMKLPAGMRKRWKKKDES